MPGTNREWGEALAGASDWLRIRSAQADAEYARQGAYQQRERQLLAEQMAEEAVVASVMLAEQRGELLTPAMRAEGAGRTKAEALDYFTGLQDAEDLRREVKTRQRLQTWEQHQQDLSSGDATAPSEADIAELAFLREKAAGFRARRALIREARLEAARDRAAERRGTPSDRRRLWHLFH